MIEPQRLSQFTRGLLYAIANYRIHSPVPLEAEEGWKFWTQPRSAFRYAQKILTMK